MAFWDKTDARIPEKVRDLSPERMLELVNFYEANKDRVATLEGDLNTTKQTLSNVETQFTETKNKLAQLEATVASQQPPKGEPDKPVQPGPTDWFEDPRKAFFEQVKPLADFSLGQGSQLAKMQLEQHLRENPGKYGDNYKLYRKFQKEISDLMSREALANQANPQAWLNAFSLIKGFHDEEISEARRVGDGEFFGEVASKGAASEPPKEDVITDKDKDLAKKYGVSATEVQAARKGLTIGDQPAKGF